MLIRDGVPLDKEAPLDELLTATGCTICLENQKNGLASVCWFPNISCFDGNEDRNQCGTGCSYEIQYIISPYYSYTNNGAEIRKTLSLYSLVIAL